MAFPAITTDNQFTIQNNQPFWSKSGRWRKHKGVYQEQAFFNATGGYSEIDLNNYPELPKAINYVELRSAFVVGSTSIRFQVNFHTTSGRFPMSSNNDAFDFQGAMFRGGSMWGQNKWRANFDFDQNGFPMNWGDGGWACRAGTVAVAYIKIHALDSGYSNLIWTCVHNNGGNTVVIKGHGGLKLPIPNFRKATFWLSGGHAGGSIAMRWS